jgi:hypothetical protein
LGLQLAYGLFLGCSYLWDVYQLSPISIFFVYVTAPPVICLKDLPFGLWGDRLVDYGVFSDRPLIKEFLCDVFMEAYGLIAFELISGVSFLT